MAEFITTSGADGWMYSSFVVGPKWTFNAWVAGRGGEHGVANSKDEARECALAAYARLRGKKES